MALFRLQPLRLHSSAFGRLATSKVLSWPDLLTHLHLTSTDSRRAKLAGLQAGSFLVSGARTELKVFTDEVEAWAHCRGLTTDFDVALVVEVSYDGTSKIRPSEENA